MHGRYVLPSRTYAFEHAALPLAVKSVHHLGLAKSRIDTFGFPWASTDPTASQSVGGKGGGGAAGGSGFRGGGGGLFSQGLSAASSVHDQPSELPPFHLHVWKVGGVVLYWTKDRLHLCTLPLPV